MLVNLLLYYSTCLQYCQMFKKKKKGVEVEWCITESKNQTKPVTQTGKKLRKGNFSIAP